MSGRRGRELVTDLKININPDNDVCQEEDQSAELERVLVRVAGQSLQRMDVSGGIIGKVELKQSN